MSFAALELFAGAGGLALGGALAGLEHRALVEINPGAGRTLQLNAGLLGCSQILTQDVRTVDFAGLGPIDLVTGGPPCQPFSVGGKGRAHQDERDMFPAAVRVIAQTCPLGFVLENVKGLLRSSFAAYFDYILLSLTYPEVTLKSGESWQDHRKRLMCLNAMDYGAGLTYQVTWQLMNAADYGVPQRRERVFIVGLRRDLGLSFSFPEPTHSQDALLWDQAPGGTYWQRHGLPPSKRPVCAMSAPLVQELALQPWRTVRDALADLPEPDERDCLLFPGHVYQSGALCYPGHTGSVLDFPAKTIKAGAHGVPGGENMLDLGGGKYRYFTVREAARLQTFPDNYRFVGSWSDCMKQIGNAVPVQLAQCVITALLSTLSAVRSNA